MNRNEKIAKLNRLKKIYERNLGRDSLREFVRLVWKYAGTRGTEFQAHWYVDAICDHLQALYNLQIKKLAVQICPRMGKSTICSVIFPVWCWLQDPTFTIISASYGANLAARDAVKSRDLILSSYFKERWGETIKLKGDVNRKTRYENTHGGYRISTSPRGEGTGEGCDLISVDDPHKAQEFDSEAQLSFVREEWYQGAMQSRYQNIETFRQLLIHQRGATNDLIGFITKVENDWTVLDLPVEYIPTTYVSPIGWSDPRTKEGEWLDKRRISVEAGLNKKINQPWVWYPQYQQRPGHTSSGYLDEKLHIRYYHPDTVPARGEFKVYISSWDLADGSIEDTASETVGQIWAVIGKYKYLIDQVAGKWAFPQQAEEFIDLKKKYPECKTHLIEIKSNAKALVDVIEKNIADGYKNYEILADDKLIRINPRDYGGDKINRFKSCLVDFTDNYVMLPGKEYPIHEKIKTGVLGMPRVAEKDVADCVSQFLNWYKLNHNVEDGLPKVETYEDYDIEPTFLEEEITYCFEVEETPLSLFGLD